MNYGSAPSPAEGNPAADALAALGGARGMTQTRTSYQTAVTVQVPRNIDAIRADVIKEATYSRDGFFYAMTFRDKSKDSHDEHGNFVEGKSVVEGCSIDGAMVLFRNWGNVALEPDLADETPAHWLFKVTVVDIEKGTSFPRLYRQRKSEKRGKFDEDRMLDIAFQIGQSKAIRNAIVNAMPQWLIDEAMEAAKAAAAKRYANVAEHAEHAIVGWGKKGVTQTQLERKLGKKRVDWIPADLVLLRAIYKAVVDGQTSVGQEFSDDPAPEKEQEQGQAAPEEKPQTEADAEADADVVYAKDEPLTPTPAGDPRELREVVPPASKPAVDEGAIAKALASIEAEKAAATAAAVAAAAPPKPAEPPAPDFAPPTTPKKK